MGSAVIPLHARRGPAANARHHDALRAELGALFDRQAACEAACDAVRARWDRRRARAAFAFYPALLGLGALAPSWAAYLAVALALGPLAVALSHRAERAACAQREREARALWPRIHDVCHGLDALEDPRVRLARALARSRWDAANDPPETRAHV